jgi:hypothetical protein
LPGYDAAGTFRRVPTRPWLVLPLVLAAFAAPAHAQTLPATAADLTGTRALSMGGAYRGLPGGNEEIFLNAAALTARRRYAIETQYLLERTGGSTSAQWLSASAVDSQLGSLAGGFAFTRVLDGPSEGNAFHLALATVLGGGLSAGVTGKYLSLSGAEKVSAATVDASLFYAVSRLLSFGAAGYNLVDVGHPQQAPRGVGAGLAIGDDRSFHVTADWRGDFDRRDALTHSWAIGTELLVGNYFPIRAGFTRDATRDDRWWSAGVGLVSTAGFALDLGYRQSTRESSNRMFGVAAKVFILSQ